jgi:hypothetical protein
MKNQSIKYLGLALLLSAGYNLMAMEPVTQVSDAIIEKYKPETDKAAVKEIYMQNWFRPENPEAAFPILLSPIDLGDKNSEKSITVLRQNPNDRIIRAYASFYFHPKRTHGNHMGWIEKFDVDTQDTPNNQEAYKKQLMNHVIDTLSKRYANFKKSEQTTEQREVAIKVPDVMTTDYAVHTNPLAQAQRQAFIEKFGFTPVGNGWEFRRPFDQE